MTMAERFEILAGVEDVIKNGMMLCFAEMEGRGSLGARAVIGELAGESGGRVHPPCVVAHNGPPIYPWVLREMSENSGLGVTEFAKSPMIPGKKIFGILIARNMSAQQRGEKRT